MSNHKLPVYSLVVLRKNNNVLILKRAPDAAYAANLYCMVGGAVEHLETPRQAIIREAKEEVGITIKPENLKFAHVFYKQANGFELMVCAFTCDTWEGEIINVEPHKHTQVLWVPENEVPKNMVPAHRSALEHMQKNIYYSEQE